MRDDSFRMYVLDPSTRAPALAGEPSLRMSPAPCRGVVPSEVEGRRSGAPGLPGAPQSTVLDRAVDPREPTDRRHGGRLGFEVLGHLHALGGR